VITIHQRHRRTDGRTDGQTTCDRNTALCTKVHRAVKTHRYNYLSTTIECYTDTKAELTLGEFCQCFFQTRISTQMWQTAIRD